MKVIAGLGNTGLSCAKFFKRQHMAFAVTDSRDNPPCLTEFKQHCFHVPLSLGQLDETLLLKADEIIISPGLPIDLPCFAKAKALGIPIVSDIEIFARHVQGQVIGITGSNGKSTTTSLLFEMAKCAGYSVQAGGNLGIPALDLLEKPSDWYLLELSSFQLENTFSLNLKAATVLNISPDHMDRHKTITEYQQAKQRIYQHCQVAIVNYQDQRTYVMQHYRPERVVYFGRPEPKTNEFSFTADNVIKGEKTLLSLSEMTIKGQHNMLNAIAALSLAEAMSLPLEAMLAGLKQFPGLPHRAEVVAKKDGVVWINDSKATNPGAVVAALKGLGQSFSGKIVLIAGGQGKDLDFAILREPVKKYVRAVILLGEDSALLKQVLHDVTETIMVNNLDQAITQARQLAQTNDMVLLSPACASFDMFAHYRERGDMFKQKVKKLICDSSTQHDLRFESDSENNRNAV